MSTIELRRTDPPFAARAARIVVAASLAASAVFSAEAFAQQPTTRIFHLRETAGIRRTEYPATVTFQLPKGALPDVSRVRVMTNSAEVPAQFTARASWDDGSVQTLDVDMNASLDPEEDRRYELQFGSTVTPASTNARGLTVSEQGDAITVGNLKFSKSGSPLLASASYRGEGIGTGSNGLTITDSSGVRFDLSKAQNASLEVVKGGPLLVALKYTATIPVDATVSIPVELLLEMPNSKTWLKTTVTVVDRTRRLRDIAVERPYAFSGFPVIWDFGTDSGTYGVFRAAADAVTLTQSTTAGGASTWKIETGPLNQRRAVETSATSRAKVAGGWGHLQDSKAAVAFGFARFGKDPGTYTVGFTGAGSATFRFAPAAPAAQHQMTLFEHFVATPIAIGAATNPTAMLTPLSITVER
ncbi:MAG: hypothetical protein U0Q11_25460 [Vicinamibacterales bacterium]